MNKSNVPVLVLKNIILLPHNEIRLEINKEEDIALISLAESYYNKHVLIIPQLDEFSINENNYPDVAVLGYINLKIELPNKKTKLVIEGLERVKVKSISEDNKTLMALIDDVDGNDLEYFEEFAYKRAIFDSLNKFMDSGNSLDIDISKLDESKDLYYITDVLPLSLNLTDNRLYEYLKETDVTNRCIMLLDDLALEEKVKKLEDDILEKVSKNIEEAQKEYYLNEKLKVVKEELGLDVDSEFKEFRERIRVVKAPKRIKDKLLKELDKLENTSKVSPDYSMIRNYIEEVLSLPWSYKTVDNDDLSFALHELNKTHFGLSSIKERIIEQLALSKYTDNKVMPVLCLVGPPGVGKTTLARSIANAMKRKYVKISVGGVNDPAEIVGHRRAYIGSSSGRIISGMKKAGTINPVFVIDEIDKMTKDIKGDPSSSLLEVLDKEQNSKFYDNYIEEEYDLSKVMFICTANYIENIPVELLDRLEVIELSSYTEYEKLNIAKSYIIPKICSEYNLKNVKISDAAILKIINSYTKEAGVRELERLISKILRKVIKDGYLSEQSFEKEIDAKDINYYLKLEKYDSNNFNFSSVGVVNGMSYTPFGGDILKIESTIYKGSGKIILTGSLGDVFKESASIAFSYIKSKCKDLKIDYKLIETSDIHIHVPEGAVKKEGPSAGIAITTSLISSFKNVKIPSNISMTGEITLNGKVLAIGGLKEKIIGAKRNGIKKIFVPKANKKELEEIEDEIKKDIAFFLVDDYFEIVQYLELV